MGCKVNKLISVIILLALSSVSLNAFSAKDKVEVCHKGKEISVAQSAVGAHVGHGDTVGAKDCVSAPETVKAVVIMRCEAGVLVSVTYSDAADVVIQPLPDDPDCTQVLDFLFNRGFALRSITSGSAGDDGLSLYTDYLLIGKIPVE